MDDAHPTVAPPAELLPAEIVKLLGSHLPLSDLLAARAACSDWDAALRPCVTAIRVRLASQQDGGSGASRAVLAASLQRMPCVASVTLVLSNLTSAADLTAALQAVGAQECVTEVTIHEAASYCTPWDCSVVLPGSRSYAPALSGLSHLRRVGVLKLTSLTWGLAEIWQHVAAMAAEGSGSTSQHALTCLELTLVGSDAREDGDHHWRACTLPPPGSLPRSLRHLTTPLPGQRDACGAVVGALSELQEAYLSGLAAGLPQLESLTVAGVYVGRERVLLGFKQLRALHVRIGGTLRSFVGHQGEQQGFEAINQALACDVSSSLQRLNLLSHESSSVTPRYAPSDDMGRRTARFKLGWLRGCTQLQHLTALLVPTGEDVGDVAGQLKSLSAVLDPPSCALLAEVAAAGTGLTALTLVDADTDCRDVSDDRRRRWQRAPEPRLNSMPLQALLQQLPHLVSLSLTASRHYKHGPTVHVFTISDPAELWSRMPHLRHLELEGVVLGPADDYELLGPRLWLRLADLPCGQLLRLKLAGYDVAVPAASSGGAEQQDAADAVRASILGQLQHLRQTKLAPTVTLMTDRGGLDVDVTQFCCIECGTSCTRQTLDGLARLA